MHADRLAQIAADLTLLPERAQLLQEESAALGDASSQACIRATATRAHCHEQGRLRRMVRTASQTPPLTYVDEGDLRCR